MKTYYIGVFIFVLLVMASVALATQTEVSKYSGQQAREIKSLSSEDIDEIRSGKGWGLAKAAELNGVPGPRHVLDLAAELSLSSNQLEQIENSYDGMQAAAIRVGSEFLASEKRLEDLFRQKTIDQEELHELLVETAIARAELRFVHLSRHLEMLGVLSAEQIDAYNALRGYTDNPCATVPAGHDADLWRRHNSCE